MANNKSLTFDIFGQDKTASKALKGVGDTASSMGKKLAAATGLAVALGAGIMAIGVGNWVNDSIGALSEWQTINAQSAAVVESTGGAANVSAEHVHALAESIERATAMEAESIQSGANMLLTFKNIRNEAGKGNDIFDQTVAIMADVATAMGTDADGAAIQLGKALNDPVAGLAALSRMGVQFTDDQKDLITSLVEAGDVMGAQKIILGELQSQFGGSGSAHAATFAGKIFLLKDAFGDLGEDLLSGVMPALGSFADSGVAAFDAIGNSPMFAAVKDFISNIAAGGATKLQELADSFTAVGENAGAADVGPLVDSMRDASPALDTFMSVADALAPILPAIKTVLGEIGSQLPTIAPAFADLAVAIVPLIPPLVELIGAILPVLVEILPPIVAALGWMAENSTAMFEALGLVIGLLTGNTTFQELGTQAANLQGPFQGVIGVVQDLGVRFGDMARGVAGFMGEFSTNVGNGINTAIGFVTSLPGRVQGAISGAGTWLINAGRDLIQGFIDGINGAIDAVGDAVSGVMDYIGGFFPHSPAKRGPFSGSGWTAVGAGGEALGAQFTGGLATATQGLELGAGLVAGMQRQLRPALASVEALVAAPAAAGAPTATANEHVRGASTRPIYADGIGLIGWIKDLANGEAQLVWATNDSAASRRVQMG